MKVKVSKFNIELNKMCFRCNQWGDIHSSHQNGWEEGWGDTFSCQTNNSKIIKSILVENMVACLIIVVYGICGSEIVLVDEERHAWRTDEGGLIRILKHLICIDEDTYVA